MIGRSEKSGIEIESEYQLTGHPVDEVPMTLVNDKSTGMFRHILVALSEYMNFIIAIIFFGIKLDQTGSKLFLTAFRIEFVEMYQFQGFRYIVKIPAGVQNFSH